MPSNPVERFREGLNARIESLEAIRSDRSLRDPGAADRVRRIAHALRGPALAYGFGDLCEAAREVEEAPDALLPGCLDRLLAALGEAAASRTRPRATAPPILVVEDDDEIAHLVKLILSSEERDVLVVGTGARGEAALEAHDVALLLLDLILPDMDGRRLLARLRASPRTASLPVVVMSARTSEKTKAECLALGADGYLEKPFHPEALAQSVLSLLRRHPWQRPTAGEDPVTGLPDQAAFRQAAGGVVGAVPRPPSTLARLSLDHFRAVNQRCGIPAADRILREVAGALGPELPAGSLLGRWAGPGFVLLLPVNDAAAEDLLRDLQDGVARTPHRGPDGSTVRVTASVGLAAVPVEGEPQAALQRALEDAEDALRRAELGGGDRLVVARLASDAIQAGERIVVAEEGDEVASLLAPELEGDGFAVVRAGDARSALEAVHDGASVVVLDVRLPGADPFDLLRRLRDAPEHVQTPVLLLVSPGADDEIVRGYRLGADDYAPRPFVASELARRVRRLARRRSVPA